ncbi:MAG: PAS domain S-box protein, partial [Actinobacteria bacterium]|nr:PAS domain S-box protein [Actinomycetota bacterium]
EDVEIIEKLTDLYIIAVRIKQAEQELEAEKEKYKALIENMYEGLWQIDKNAVTVFANIKMAEMLGYTVEEMIGISLFEFMDARGKKLAEKNLQRRKSGIKEEHDFEFIKKDGSRILTRLETAPLFNKNGDYNGALANISDITERKHMEETLQSNEKMLKKIFEILPVGLWFADKSGKLIMSNKKGREIWGAEPLVGQQEYGVFKARRLPSGKEIEPDDWALAHTINEGVTVIDEMLEIDAFDGKKKIILNYTAPVTNERGEVEAGIVVNLDITKQAKAENELNKSYGQIKKTLEGAINTLSSILEIKDPYTGNHQRNVAKLCRAMAGELLLDEDKEEMLYTAALIHDIGKIAIPASILSKPSELSGIEISMIHTHSQVGYEILSKIDFGYPLSEIVLQHHERIDGSGYPNGLKDMDILFDAKVLAVADTVEAMANHRPYRPAHGIEEALKEIQSKRGIFYNESAVDACMAVFAKKKFKFHS